MNEVFESICRMTQEEVKTYVERELKITHKDVYVGDGYVYAQGTFPVLLLAHMDTVHKETPQLVLYDPTNGSVSSPQGIGGDDRCGVFMVLEIVKRFNCSVLFCEDEEVGGVGARKFIQTDLAHELKFNYAIEFDRKGKNDAVFYDCDNEDFEEFITKEFYKTAYGSFSDISVVAPFLGCAAVNLSCGYYNAHSTKEYVVITEMITSINAACRILERTTEKDEFEYIEATYNNYGWPGYGYNGYGNGYANYGYRQYNTGVSYYSRFWETEDEEENEDDVELYYLFEYVDEYGDTQWYEAYAFSETDAVGQFCMAHPLVPYANIIDIMVDDVYGNKKR
jgi:hypothetical protein